MALTSANVIAVEQTPNKTNQNVGFNIFLWGSVWEEIVLFVTSAKVMIKKVSYYMFASSIRRIRRDKLRISALYIVCLLIMAIFNRSEK